MTIRSERIGSSPPDDAHGVGVLEHGVARQQADAVAAELLAHHGGLGGDHARRAVEQLAHRLALGLLGPRRVEHVQRPLRQVLEHRLAQRLGRDRAGMDRDAAEPVAPLDDGDALAELGGLDRRPLAAGAGSDDEKVELHRGQRTL